MLPPLRELGLPLTSLLSLFSYPPLREVGIAYLSERTSLTKVLGSTFLGKPTPQKLRGNFSEKPPDTILVWGQDGLDGGSKEGTWEGAGDGWSRAFPHSHAALNHTAHPSHWENPDSPGKGQGKGPAKGQGKGNAKPQGARNRESQTSLRKSQSDCRGGLLHQMQSLQLDELLCVPFMWDSTSPGEQTCHTPPLIWPGHHEIWGCFFFFCGFFWAFLRRCGKRGSPSTASTPPGVCRLDLVIRRHGWPDRYVTAMRPSCCGGARRRRRELEGGGKRPRVGPYANAVKTPREVAALANPALVSKLAQSVAFLQNARAHLDAEQSGHGSSLRETQVASASEVAGPRPEMPDDARTGHPRGRS